MLPSLAMAQQTVAADRFVDSAGVNVHLHYVGTPYWDQFPLIRSRLIELGVRHVRDGIVDTPWQPYYERLNSLGAAGIKASFLTTPQQSTELWASYPARASEVFEGFEAPNEYDKSGDPNWAETLRQTIVRLHSLKGDPRAAQFPVYGPALVGSSAHATLGDMSAYFDAANMHNYLAGRNPGTPGWGGNGYGSIAWNLRQIQPYSGGKPVVTTETGYQGIHTGSNFVPQEVAGRYMPRVLLEQFRAGIGRTYIYELLDFTSSGSFGLLNPDGSPKPSYTAVKGLLNLLADPGPVFTPQDLGYTVQGGTNRLHHLAFQKRDGSYFLALWVELPSYDPPTGELIAVPAQSVTVTLPQTMRHLRTHRWQLDGSVSIASSTTATKTIPVSVADRLTIIELVEPPPPDGGLPGAPSALTATVNYRSVLFGWQAPTDGGTPTGYTIEAAATLDFANATTMEAGPLTQLLVPDVASGVYFARIRARNGQGSGPPSAVTEVTIGAPTSPQLLVLQAFVNPVVLSWSPAAGADHYIVSAGSSPGASDLAVVDMGRATYLVSSAPVGMRIHVRVAAVNTHGATRSNEVSFAVPGALAPGEPNLAEAQVNGTRVTLSWSPGSGGAPQNYVLLLGTAPGAANVATIPLGTTTTVAGESPVTGSLFARIVAQNALGSAASNEIAFSIGGSVGLETPTMHQPIVAGSSVQLSWTVGGLASSYLLLARATPTGPVIASVPVADLQLNVSNVPGGTYFVSVIARRDGHASAESNQVAVAVGPP